MPDAPVLYPVLDLSRIRTLAQDLGTPVPALRFLNDYISMLPGRIHRIRTALQDQDPKTSMDALLSLKVTSAMAGALETEAHCRAIETLIRENRYEHALRAAERLTTAETSTHRCPP